MLYVDKDNAHRPSIEIAKAKRVLKNTDGVEVCYDSLGQLQEASQLIPHLWDSLGADQGWLCVYCMRCIAVQPVSGVSRKLHNEHYIPRHQDYEGYEEARRHGKEAELPYPQFTQADLDRYSLDYRNLFAVCDGKYQKDEKAPARDGHRAPHRKEDEESSGPKVTCDTLRGNSKLTVDPRRKDHIDSLSYGKFDATLSSSIPEVNDDINVRLNLNYHWLKEERAMALVGLYQWFEKNASERDFPRKCRERLQELQQGKDGKLQPFAPMLIWALTKRMRRLPHPPQRLPSQ